MLVLDIYGLFKMVFDCLLVVVDIFEVVSGGRRSFLLLVTTVSAQVSLGQVQNTGHTSLFYKYRNNPNHLQVLTLGLKMFP